MEEDIQLGMSFQSWWLGEKYFSSLYKFIIFDLKLLKDMNYGTSHQCFYSNSAEETNVADHERKQCCSYPAQGFKNTSMVLRAALWFPEDKYFSVQVDLCLNSQYTEGWILI